MEEVMIILEVIHVWEFLKEFFNIARWGIFHSLSHFSEKKLIRCWWEILS